METPGQERQAGGWLPPTAALDRFEPPEGALFEAAEAVKERTRYGFRIGTINLVIGMNTGSEVMPLPSLAAVPNTPSWLKGMLNLRGNLVPVFDLKLLLALEEQEQTGKPMVLVLDKGDKAVGMIVDGFPQPLAGLRRVQRVPELPKRLEACVPASYTKDDALWVEFDHEGFFTALHEQALS